MQLRAEVFEALSLLFAEELQARFDDPLIDGQTVLEKYGLTRDTCRQYRVGLVAPDFDLHHYLKEKFSLTNDDFIHHNGFGFLHIPPFNPFRAISNFAGRLMFTYLRAGAPIYFSGRLTDQSPPSTPSYDQPKFRHFTLKDADLPHKPLFLSAHREEPAFLVEGPAQALRLRQEGFAAIAMSGLLGEEQIKELDQLERLIWIPDVDVLAPIPSKIEEREGLKKFVPGATREQKFEFVAKTLRKMPRCRIIEYPSDFCQQHKRGDMNDWWKLYPQPSAFLALIEHPIDLHTAEIFSISRNGSDSDRAAKIAEWLPTIAHLSPIEYAGTLEKLKNHLNLKPDQMNHLKQEVKKLRASGMSIEDIGERITSDFRQIYPGQDWVDGKLYYTISKKTIIRRYEKNECIESVDEKPYMISSAGDFFAADETELTRRRLYFKKGCIADNVPHLWSDNIEQPYSFPAWLAEREANTPDTKELFAEIRQYFQDHLFVDYDPYYDFLSLFTMVSYCLQIFESFGFLAFNGTRGTGKSRAMELIESIAFDPVKASSQSDSFLYRAVDTRSPTLFLDEAESLSSIMKTKDQVNEKSLMLHDAYRKGGGVGRCVGENSIPYVFRIFTTICISNTRGLHAMLQSRTFYFPMTRCPKDRVLESWNRIRVASKTNLLRAKLYCWTLSHASKIAQTYDRLDNPNDLAPFWDILGIRDREREIWTPIYSIAFTLDELMGHRFDYRAPDSLFPKAEDGRIAGRVLMAQQRLSKLKDEIMIMDDVFPRFLGALRMMLRDKTVPSYSIDTQPENRRSGWYSVKEITNWINSLEGLKYFPSRSGQNGIRPLLSKKVKILLEGDECRWRKPGDSGRNYIRLDLGRVEIACDAYGVPDQVDLEAAESSATSPDQQEIGA